MRASNMQVVRCLYSQDVGPLVHTSILTRIRSSHLTLRQVMKLKKNFGWTIPSNEGPDLHQRGSFRLDWDY